MGNDNLERNLKSEPKKFSRLCTFKAIGHVFWGPYFLVNLDCLVIHFTSSESAQSFTFVALTVHTLRPMRIDVNTQRISGIIPSKQVWNSKLVHGTTAAVRFSRAYGK